MSSESSRIPSYQRRLEHARELWHRALKAYPNADDFTNAVNDLIPALRTVTFIIQKDLKHVEGFDDWYAYWQREMLNDVVMRWLVEARNHIEKQGDLDIRSTARVEVIAGWPDTPVDEFDVPPLLSPQVVAYEVAKLAPDFVREEGLIRVQRRWVTNALPDHEILEACAHGWAVLSDVVSDANAFVESGEPQRPGARRPPEDLEAGVEARTAVYHLAAEEFVQPTTTRIERDEDLVETAAKRYGLPPELDVPMPSPDADLESRVRWHHEVSRRVFGVDGHLLSFAVMFQKGRVVDLLGMEMADQQAKYIVLEQLAARVAATDADEVVHSYEVWIAPLVGSDDPLSGLRAGQRADRAEAVVTYGMARNGDEVQVTSFATREADRVVLADVVQGEPVLSQMYHPVRRVWGLPTTRAGESAEG